MVRLRRFSGLVLVLALGLLLSGARNPGDLGPAPPASAQEVTVVGVFSDPRGQHGVLLEGKRDRRRVLMVIGAAEATAIAFPGLVGVLPGLGRQEPNDWGLGFELKDAKRPHWTGSANSPRTFGHFGGAGTFLWVDPDAGAACACLTDLEFAEWALAAWPSLADAVLGELAAA